MEADYSWQVGLALKCNQLMKQYIEERIAQPYNGAQTTSKYVQLTVDLLSDVLRDIDETSESVDSFADALLLVKCFSATVFAPFQPVTRMARFLDWVHSVQPELTEFSEQVSDQILSVSKMTPQAWKLVRSLLLFGQFDKAQQVLESSDVASDPLVEDLLSLIRAYPVNTQKISIFMVWRQNCLAFLSNLESPAPTAKNPRKASANSTTAKLVANVASILVGNSEDILGNAETWIDALSGLCLYSDPTFEDVESNFQLAYERHGMSSSMPTWEEGCRALFESRVVAALGSLKLLDLNSAIVISEFCQETDLLRKYSGQGSEIRESLGLEYIEELLRFPELVEIGVEMLVNLASADAKQYAQQTLPELVRRDAGLADLAIDAAEQLGLSSLEGVLCENAAQACWEKEHYTAAIELWYRAGNSAELHQRSWELFRHILVTRLVPDDEITLTVLQDFGAAVGAGLPSVVRDNLAPAAVLVGLLTSLDTGDFEGIVTNIQGLLAFPNPPLEYYPLLVALVSQAPIRVVSTSGVLMLMNALDMYDDAAEETKQLSLNLINEAAGHENWAGLANVNPADAVWHLRKQLAREIVL